MKILKKIAKIPWNYIIIGCLSLGLAPFAPPHIVEKFMMLINGKLTKAIDWFDFLYHGIPWILLLIKSFVLWKEKKASAVKH